MNLFLLLSSLIYYPFVFSLIPTSTNVLLISISAHVQVTVWSDAHVRCTRQIEHKLQNHLKNN